MSFILDALRKSETARRRSEAPDLFTTMPNAAPPAPPRRQWPMLAVGGVGVLSLIAALWLFAQRTPAPAPAETSAAAGPSVEANAPPPPPPPPEPAPADPAGTHPTRDVAAVEPKVGPAVPAARIPTPAEPVVATPAPPRESPPAPATPSPVVEPLPAPPVAAQSPGDRIVSIADLDPGMRSQLPPLKLSMHLWNETPSQRFVILDGQRMKEGDAIGEVVIERITRDGAVLAWRGGRMKIELR